jgi:hypothetical protein
MAVIINELEIVTEPPESAEGPGDGETPAPAGSAAPKPDDIESIMRQYCDRTSRLYAA